MKRLEWQQVIRSNNHGGDIRDSTNHLLGKIGSNGDVRNNNNSYLGKVESYLIVRNSNKSTIGKVESNGTVRDSNNHSIVYAIGVSMKYTAVFSFLLLFDLYIMHNFLEMCKSCVFCFGLI